MSTGGSSSPTMFDFHSERGVLAILQAVKKAALPKVEERLLRDLIFSYSHSRGDAALRAQLEEQLRHCGVMPLTLPAVNDHKGADAIVGRRAVPVFKVGVSASAVPVTAPVVPITPPRNPSHATAPVVSASPAVQVPPPTPVGPPPTPTPTRVSPVIPVPPPVSPASLPPVETVPVQSMVPPDLSAFAPTVSPAPAPAPAASAPSGVVTATTGTALERITTIKADINKRIGNPVTLVDVDNTIGRAYMSALLEAMKAVSANTGVVESMNRLETAYAAACTLLDHVGASTAPMTMPEVPPVPPVPAFGGAVRADMSTAPMNVSEPRVAVVPPSVPQTPGRPPLPVMPALTVADAVSAPTDTPVDSVFINSSLRQTPVAVPTAPLSEVSETTSIPINRPPYVSDSPRVVSPQIIVSPPVSPQTPRIQIQASPLAMSSVGSAPPLKDISVLPTAASINTASEGVDPLFTKEVDDGLDQLLQEWVLFNRSGFLGRGPNKRQHPLYLKIANLPVTLILAGRFEGATNEVMQDISDKMNGWRYQQGVIYQKDESLEHYLRRVIRRILDWHQKKKTA